VSHATTLTGLLASNYLGRYVFFNRPTSRDQSRLPQRPLAASPAPVALGVAARPVALDRLRLDVPAVGGVRLSDSFPPSMWWAPLLRRVAEAAAGA